MKYEHEAGKKTSEVKWWLENGGEEGPSLSIRGFGFGVGAYVLMQLWKPQQKLQKIKFPIQFSTITLRFLEHSLLSLLTSFTLVTISLPSSYLSLPFPPSLSGLKICALKALRHAIYLTFFLPKISFSDFPVDQNASRLILSSPVHFVFYIFFLFVSFLMCF